MLISTVVCFKHLLAIGGNSVALIARLTSDSSSLYPSKYSCCIQSYPNTTDSNRLSSELRTTLMLMLSEGGSSVIFRSAVVLSDEFCKYSCAN